MEGFHSKTQALLTLVILKKILIQFFFFNMPTLYNTLLQ